MIFRAKTIFNGLGYQTFTANINGQNINKFVYVIPKCNNGLIVKYLDNNGYYRFFQFSEKFREQLTNKDIGQITNIINDKSTIGKTATKTIVASAVIEEQFWNSLKYLIVSPSIYLKINEKWIKAKINDGNYIIRKSKGNLINLDVQFEIEFNTIIR